MPPKSKPKFKVRSTKRGQNLLSKRRKAYEGLKKRASKSGLKARPKPRKRPKVKISKPKLRIGLPVGRIGVRPIRRAVR